MHDDSSANVTRVDAAKDDACDQEVINSDGRNSKEIKGDGVKGDGAEGDGLNRHAINCNGVNDDVAESYHLLHLSPQAELAEVKAAYLKYSYEAFLQGDRPKLRQIKAAYRAISSHLQRTHSQPHHASETAQARDAEGLNSKDSRHQHPSSASGITPEHATQALTDLLHRQGMVSRVRIRQECVQIGLNIAHISNRATAISSVYTLLADLPHSDSHLAEQLTTIKTVQVYGLTSPKKAVWKETFAMPNQGPNLADRNRRPSKNRVSNILLFPAIAALAVMLNSNPIANLLLRGLHIWIHEFGHATVAWLSGYRAIPLPFGWTNTSLEQSWLVYGGILVLLGLLFWSGYREQRRWPMVLAIALVLVQFVMTWVISAHRYQMLLAFGGIGGEFYLSTLLLVSFFFSLPIYWQWDVWRYPVAIAAAYTFWHSFDLWQRIEQGQAAIPWGALWDGVSDVNGDMNILSAQYNWSDQDIITTYTTLGNGCLVILVIVYLGVVMRQTWPLLYGIWQRLVMRFST